MVNQRPAIHWLSCLFIKVLFLCRASCHPLYITPRFVKNRKRDGFYMQNARFFLGLLDAPFVEEERQI